MHQGDAYETDYMNALDANDYEYSYWPILDSGNPDLALLSDYELVIWFTGDDFFDVLSSTDQNNIADGDILNLIELSNDVFVISRHRSQVDEVANQLAREWQDSGQSLESMLKTLRQVRAEYDEKNS